MFIHISNNTQAQQKLRYVKWQIDLNRHTKFINSRFFYFVFYFSFTYFRLRLAMIPVNYTRTSLTSYTSILKLFLKFRNFTTWMWNEEKRFHILLYIYDFLYSHKVFPFRKLNIIMSTLCHRYSVSIRSVHFNKQYT